MKDGPMLMGSVYYSCEILIWEWWMREKKSFVRPSENVGNNSIGCDIYTH